MYERDYGKYALVLGILAVIFNPFWLFSIGAILLGKKILYGFGINCY